MSILSVRCWCKLFFFRTVVWHYKWSIFQIHSSVKKIRKTIRPVEVKSLNELNYRDLINCRGRKEALVDLHWFFLVT